MVKLDKNNIPGIYNYCDRWCEKCHFTSKCAVYENPDDIPAEEKDAQNEAFWNKISENFASAIIMLKKAAAEHGVDLDNLPPEEVEAMKKHDKETDDFVDSHPLVLLAERYTLEAHQWLKSNNYFEEKKSEVLDQIKLGIHSDSSSPTILIHLSNYLEIIQWYLFFTETKWRRALFSKFNEKDYWEEENGFQKDSDGSAKIALIAVERTMQAWAELFKIFPEKEDDILKFLSLLQKLKLKGEQEFPQAWDFIRPGFDE